MTAEENIVLDVIAMLLSGVKVGNYLDIEQIYAGAKGEVRRGGGGGQWPPLRWWGFGMMPECITQLISVMYRVIIWSPFIMIMMIKLQVSPIDPNHHKVFC